MIEDATPKNLILTDVHVRQHLSMAEAIDIVERCLQQKEQGTFQSIPRLEADGEGLRLIFSVGGSRSGAECTGFRVYDAGCPDRRMRFQLTAAWSGDPMGYRTIVIGEALGVLRTGAIGGAAIRRLCPLGVRRATVFGTGPQAESQIDALLLVRPTVERLSIFGRNRQRLSAFCRKIEQRFNLVVVPAVDVADAIHRAEVIICATDSAKPFFEFNALSTARYLATLGPKQRGRQEISSAVIAGAQVVATDSWDQIRSYRDGHVGLTAAADVVELSTLPVLSGEMPHCGLSVFLSVGMPGTEAVLAQYLAEKILPHSEVVDARDIETRIFAM